MFIAYIIYLNKKINKWKKNQLLLILVYYFYENKGQIIDQDGKENKNVNYFPKYIFFLILLKNSWVIPR